MPMGEVLVYEDRLEELLETERAYNALLEIPEKWIKMANLPVEHSRWYSSSGEEYYSTSDAEYVVLNTKLGNSRMRQVCKILSTVVINPEEEKV